MSDQFDASQTSQVVKFFRNQGRTIIPIRKNTKSPKAATGDVEKWKVEGCTVPITDGDSIAMLHGQVSGTWASDLDDPTILDDLLIDNMQKSKMLIVKTPRRGHHIIWEFIPDDYPPKDTSFHDKNGRTIDIKCKGSTLLPPSSHPDTEKKYEFLENTSMVPAKMKWSDFEFVLSEKGFFTQNEVNGQNSKNDYDIDVLLLGKFPRGTRRISENSLYCKLRNKGYPKNLVEEKIHEVNSKCDEPLTEQEVKRNCQYAENYFQNVVKTPELKNNQIRKTTPVLLQDIPLDLDLTLEAVKYVRSPVYKAKLKRLTKENPEYLTVESIKTDLIAQFLVSTEKFMMDAIPPEKLEEIAKKILSWDKDLEYNLAMEFVKMKLDFAHVVNTSEVKDFNCSVYDSKSYQWTDKSPDQILSLLKNAHLEDLKANNKMALNLSRDISGEAETLKVYKNEKYRQQRLNMIIDTFGNYFDLEKGALGKINPEIHYFETVDVRFDLEKGGKEPTEFIAFLKDRFGDDKWEIVRDHLAGTFLGPNLGQKTKLLFIVGSTDTWKSFLLEGFADLFSTEGAVSNVSLSQMADDKVFGPATIVNRFLNYSEETKPKMPDNQSTMKDIITKIGGSVRKMHTTKHEYAWRWPRWIVAANKLPPISEDDEDDSIYNRYSYVETLPVPSEPQKDWRALINNNTSKQNILIYLLERAHEILKDPKCMVLQELEEARQEYSRLIVGDIGEIIKTHFEIRADTKGVGVGWINFLNLVREESGSKISKNHLMQILESMGLEKKSRQYSREAENEGSYMICGPSEGIQRTLIMGMKMKDNVDCSKCKERV